MDRSQAQRPRIKTRHPGVYYRERPDGSRQYMVWFQGTDGKPHWQNTAGGEKDAVRARARIIDRKARGEKIAPSRVLFSTFAQEWLEERTNLSPKSIACYRSQIDTHLVPRLGRHTRLSGVDVNHVAALVAEMQKEGYKAWSIRATLKPLSGIMRTAVRRGLAPANPVDQLERSERPVGDSRRMNILDTDEIQLMLNHAGSFRLLFRTAVFTGLRISELLALRWEDIDWEEGVIHVRGTKTKAAKRDVVLAGFLSQDLAKRSLDSDGVLELVFPCGATTVRTALKKALGAAGITKPLRFHDLRHTFASILIHQGHPDSFIAEQMGHTSGAFTRQQYGHMLDGKKQMERAREMMEVFG